MASFRFSPSRIFTLDEAERAISDFGAELSTHDHFELDLSKVRQIAPGAGARFGNALRLLASKRDVQVVLPEDSSNSHVLAGLENVDWPLLVQSGLTESIAAHASTVISVNGSVTDVFRGHFGGKLIRTPELVLVPRLHSGNAINVNDFDAFSAQLRSWEEALPFPLAQNSAADFHELAQVCFEAIQNVYDHSGRSPHPADSPVTSFLLLRHHSIISTRAGHQLSGYLIRRSARLGSRRGGFIEILISDDGVGIPARQAGTLDIYEQSILKEVAVLEEALEAAGSVKLRSLDSIVRGDPGYGYTKIGSAISKLGGWASLRTGRVHAVLDSTRSPPTVGKSAFRSAKAKYGLEYGWMAGTTLQVILPMARTSQGTLGMP